MKKLNNENKGELKLKKFLIAKIGNPQIIVGGNINGDDPIETFPTQKPYRRT